MNASIHITRDKPGAFFKSLHEQGLIDVTSSSCIDLIIEISAQPPSTDWIFFTSPSSAELFQQHFSIANRKLAALGKGTAAVIPNTLPIFIPKAHDPEKAVKEFAEVLGKSETVLSPIGNKSLRRLNEIIPTNQLVEFPFYRTASRKKIAPIEASFILFTSPSNVLSYLDKHKAKPGQIAIAMGNSTFKALVEGKWPHVMLADAPDESVIWSQIKSRLS